VEQRVRILIADDSAVIRRLLTSALLGDTEVEVVGAAVNGREALRMISELSPDALLCDLEMPEMDGISTVQALRRTNPRLPVVMFSSPTDEGARTTLDCLHAGANDFVTKPSFTSGTAMDAVLAQLRGDLCPKIKALCRGPGDLSSVARAAIGRRAADQVLAPAPAPAVLPAVVPLPAAKQPVAAPPTPAPTIPPAAPVAQAIVRNRTPAPVQPSPTPLPVASPPPTLARPASRTGRIEAVVIGVSTGGPNALADMVPRLPRELSVPVLVVQHMPPVFTRLLAERLAAKSALAVREAQAGEAVTAGAILLAPGDQHLVVRREGGAVRCGLNRDLPENSVRPAADVLFRSAAEVWGGNVLVVVMTGMGQDGLQGALHLHRLGASVIAQDEATSVVWGMPGAVAKAGIAERIVPLGQIADEIAARCRGGR
jgi:two-component system chemotaxis response regulator CheB